MKQPDETAWVIAGRDSGPEGWRAEIGELKKIGAGITPPYLFLDPYVPGASS